MNLMPILFLVLAVVAMIVNIFLLAQGGGLRPSGLAVRAILLLVAIGCVVMAWRYRSYDAFKNPKQRWADKLRRWSFESDRFDAIHLEWSYQKVQARVLGRYLAEKYAGKRCVILREPIMKDVAGKNSVNPAIEGLREGLGNNVTIVKELEIGKLQKPEPLPEGEEEPVEMGLKKNVPWTADDLEEMLVEAGDFDLLISCVQLPEDFIDNHGRFTPPSLAGRKVALLGGYSQAYDNVLAEGSIVAAVTFKPDCRFDEKDIPKDDKEAFDKRYLLLEGGPRVEILPELLPVIPPKE
ncbi:MAG: hypothetical protein J6W23_10995 [Victivallales bacterium]|nr:hypothetical protein [Victivallales bacterium]